MRPFASACYGGCLVLLFVWAGCGGSGCGGSGGSGGGGSGGGGSPPSGPGTPRIRPGPQVPDDVCAALLDHPEYRRTAEALASHGYANPGVLAAGMLLAAGKVPAATAACPCSTLRFGE